MGRHKKEDPPSAGAPLWVTTYGDMMSLLLTFFILLYSFSVLDLQRFRQAMISLQRAFGVLPGGTAVLDPGSIPIQPEPPPPEAMDEYVDDGGGQETMDELGLLQVELTQYLAVQGLAGRVKVEMTKRGLLIRFTDTVLFDLGRAELRSDSRKLLKDMAQFIAPIKNAVIVEGHTDNLRLRPEAQFATNWELSTARATTVVRYFVEGLSMKPGRFSAAGYGEYHPIMPNDIDANRALNRRVDLVIIASE
ncbi:MAG: flagellar motor protein MotB [Clostridia bacterium]|nr:flagellar motor protein MotB [Clostridia bacterium]